VFGTFVGRKNTVSSLCVEETNSMRGGNGEERDADGFVSPTCRSGALALGVAYPETRCL
jgi:hypothetical protein